MGAVRLFVSPHFPLTAPPEHFYRYYDDPACPMPKLYERSQRPDSPVRAATTPERSISTTIFETAG